MVKIAIPNFCINFLNKTVKSLSILCDFAVAPFTGAWIKINVFLFPFDNYIVAPFMVRGLKQRKNICYLNYFSVGTLGDVWIKASYRKNT